MRKKPSNKRIPYAVLAESERLAYKCGREALEECVNAIYFNDSSDYLKALWRIVRILTASDIHTMEQIRELCKEIAERKEEERRT